MSQISTRSQSMGQSPMRELLPYAEAAKKEGVLIYHLNIGQPDIPTPASAFEALKNFNGVDGNMVDEYTKSQGLDELRESFATYLALTGVPLVTAENILVTEGGSEGLQILSFVLFEHGDKVIAPEPFYANYSTFTKYLGVEVIPYTTKLDDNFSLQGIAEGIEKLVKENKGVKGILFSNPGNPTGAVYTQEELDALADLAEKYDLWLIADEVYREFVFDGEEPRSMLNNQKVRDRLVVVDSSSKRWSACGARVGFIITRNKDVYMGALKVCQSRLSAARVAQTYINAVITADVAALQEGKQTTVDTAKTEYNARKKVAYNVFHAAGIACGYPKGALYMIVELGQDAKSNPYDAKDFARFMLRDFRVDGKTAMITFAAPFYHNQNLGKSQFRLAFVLDAKKTKDAAGILVDGMKEYKNRHPEAIAFT